VIPPDSEIHAVEERIAQRRHDVEFYARDSAHRAFRALTSPGALVGAAVVGFLAGGGVGKRKPHYADRRKNVDKGKAAKATGIAGAVMSGAMWLVKQQFGSPVQLAQFLIAKFAHRKASPYGDVR
jgi:hypothetical protein